MKQLDDDSGRAAIYRAVEWMLIVIAVSAVLGAVVIPRLGGGTPYVVLTGSMSPRMPPGSLVIVRDVEVDDIASGDVITFMPKPNDPDVVTHRVVGQGFDVTGAKVLRTQGDANNAPDPWLVRDYQIVGKRWYYVPYLGYAIVLLTGEQRRIGIYLAAAALIFYALVMFAGAFRDRIRRRPEGSRA